MLYTKLKHKHREKEMLYFRCRYYNKCGGDSCVNCPIGKVEKMKELNAALLDLSLILPAAPTANEIYVAIQKAEKKYGRKK